MLSPRFPRARSPRSTNRQNPSQPERRVKEFGIMLKPRWIVAFLFALLMAGKSGVAADLSGKWIAAIGTQYARVSLVDEGGKLTGTWGEFKLTGSISGDKVDLSLTDDSGAVAGSLTGT